MFFVYRYWDEFCNNLKAKNRTSIPACEVKDSMSTFLVLKHDIENNVHRAYRMAEIEKKYGHKGSYYVQAYLLENPKNVELLKRIHNMGHEVSYHYDVMDSTGGVMENAIKEFEANKKKFENLGFRLITVCQHGNPLIERVGYTSNRDFFRSDRIQKLYPDISDIMVDFKRKYHTDYSYYSDAGRKFKLIYDPINNDIVNSDSKNVPYEDLNALLSELPDKAIISTHPHRWRNSEIVCKLNNMRFRVIKTIAKTMMKFPVIKKVMSRYYYLAKKI